jgi:hypothetical protein
LSSPTCLCCLVLDVLSKMSYPDQSVLSGLSCPGGPVPAVLLFQLPCPGHLVHCSPDTTVISWQSCELCLFRVHLSRLTDRADLSRLSCPNCLVPLSCPDYPVLDVLSRLPVLFVLSQMSSLKHDCSTQLSCLSCPVLAVIFWPFSLCFLSWLFYPVFSRLSCPSCPIPAVQSRLCAALSQLFCSSSSAPTT